MAAEDKLLSSRRITELGATRGAHNDPYGPGPFNGLDIQDSYL